MTTLQYRVLDGSRGPAKRSNILDLPNELLRHVLLFTPAHSIVAFQQVCRRFAGVVDSLNWRQLCHKHFRYWDPNHGLRIKARNQPQGEDWKRKYIIRHRAHDETTRLLNSILSTQVDRIDKFQQIIAIGYDAKDCLLQHLAVGDEAEDVLARR